MTVFSFWWWFLLWILCTYCLVDQTLLPSMFFFWTVLTSNARFPILWPSMGFMIQCLCLVLGLPWLQFLFQFVHLFHVYSWCCKNKTFLFVHDLMSTLSLQYRHGKQHFRFILQLRGLRQREIQLGYCRIQQRPSDIPTVQRNWGEINTVQACNILDNYV